MNNLARCFDCGAPIPAGQPKSLCPRCALSGLLNSDSAKDEAVPVHKGVGKDFGDYELLEEIARGGMGVVYKARQKSLDRIVAVKLLPAGPHTSDDLIKRFRVEASAAAALQHPNIVAIHEVGVHEGEHFLAMDYVDGPNLAKFVREQPLSPKQAAAYLKTIAEAIHYAHEKGILHRDLKPSNVLVDSNDQPRVTDFGLAKRVGTESQPGTGVSELTQSGQVMGSPGYMPPEQISSAWGKASRRSDVYSLGAMLYHLLTGRPPFGGGSPAETLHRVLNENPVPTHLLNPRVPVDLETICLKCLCKEPNRRYSSALELAEDLNRFVSGEPVLARPAGNTEKFWLWCRRKPAVAALSFGVLVSLLMGTAVSTWQAVNAKRAKDRVAEEAIGSDAGAHFLSEILGGIRPAVAQGRDVTVLREVLSNAAVRVQSGQLTNQPRAQATFLGTLAAVYFELGDYVKSEEMARRHLEAEQNNHGREDIHVVRGLALVAKAVLEQGKYSEAERLLREALAIQRRVSPKDLTELESSLAEVLRRAGKQAEARVILQDQLARLQKQPNNKPAVVRTMMELGGMLIDEQKWTEAEQTFRQSLELIGKGVEVSEQSDSVLNGLAVALSQQRRFEEAEPLIRQVLEFKRRKNGEQSIEFAAALGNAATQFTFLRRHQEAHSLLRQALAIREKVFGTNHPVVAECLQQFAVVLLSNDRFEEAETNLLRVLAIQGARLGPAHPDIAETFRLMGVAYLRKQPERACEMFRRAIDIRRRHFGTNDPMVLELGYELGDRLIENGKWDEAEAVAHELLSLPDPGSPPDPGRLVSLGNIAFLLVRRDRLTEAEQVLERAFSEQKRLPQNQQTNLFEPRHQLIELLVGAGKWHEAELRSQELLEEKRKTLGETNRETIAAYSRLASVFRNGKKFREAAQTYRTTLSLSRKLHGEEHEGVAGLHLVLGETLVAGGVAGEAIPEFRAALNFWQKSVQHDVGVFQASMNLAMALCEQGEMTEARQLFHQGFKMMRKEHGARSEEVAKALCKVGSSFLKQRAYSDAEEYFQEAFQIWSEKFGDNHHTIADALHFLGDAKAKEPEQAEKYYRKEIAIREQSDLSKDPEAADAFHNLGVVLRHQEKLEEAREAMEMALKLGRTSWTNDPVKLARTMVKVSELWATKQQHNLAEPLMLEATQMLLTNVQATVSEKRQVLKDIHQFYTHWAAASPGSGKLEEALRWLRRQREFQGTQAQW